MHIIEALKPNLTPSVIIIVAGVQVRSEILQYNLQGSGFFLGAHSSS